jgi:hypothetical protein
VLVPFHKTRSRWLAATRVAGLLTAAVWLVACDKPVKLRSVEFFMEDGLAREGVLARCNQDRRATAGDEECENARRAAMTLAAAGENERSADLEKESARKLSALRDRQVRQQQAEQDAATAAKAAADAAYEAQWREKNSQSGAAGSEPISDAGERFVERESLSQLPTRPELKLAAVAPPPSDLKPQKPEIEQTAIIPRPFRATDSAPKN